MEDVPIASVVQARELVAQQIAIDHGGIDEGRAVLVLAVQIVLIDDLVGPTARSRVHAIPRIVIALDTIESDGLGSLDLKVAACINGDVTRRSTTHPRCMQF